MNTAIRIALGVACVVAIGGAGWLLALVFQGAAACAGSGFHATPLEVLEAAVIGQAAFVALGYFVLFIGYLFGTQAVAKRRGFSRRTPVHLMTAGVLATATVVLVGTPFLFAG
jgi:hypothetical protein